MSMFDKMEVGKSTVYDTEGRTRIPDDVRESLGWKKGDRLKMVAIEGELRITKRDGAE